MDGIAERRLETCRRLITERQLVGQHIGFNLCPCPAWDILLDLYAAECEQRPIYLWSLSVAANIPVSSAHRKIIELIDRGLLARSADPEDGRRVTVSLAPAFRPVIEDLLDRIDEKAGPRK
ncbi:MarR family transcriptional regulator [Sphingomonas sp. BIUV-7]|uniref:MarR family transcriptional regulator n=1 Tax=Sphingomonas natans TaxID=3063330 RepID=A0ABT8YAM3_9SPHN|nr:MarR family transcriptional regulator [Sphingomonas sp. BIUV-7]MDO6415388.1 MarR family transcriptional regulator [Sphingomonas sp. BIUV-7]